MVIREAMLSDAAGIAKVHVDTWRSTYRGIIPDARLESLCYETAADAARQRLGDTVSGSFTLVADTGHEVVGFAGAGPAREGEVPRTGELYAIYVLDTHQRIGIGRLLVRAVVTRLLAQGMCSLLVWVLKDNPARAFYGRLGGEVLGSKTINIGGRDLEEVSYGWEDMAVVLDLTHEQQ